MKFVTQTAILNGILTIYEKNVNNLPISCVNDSFRIIVSCYVLVLILQDVAKIDCKSVNFNWLGKACIDMY